MNKKYILFAAGTSTAALFLYKTYVTNKKIKAAADFLKPHSLSWRPDTRQRIINNLGQEYYDIVIVGGGSSGAGCALDATTRGLKVALLECGDFASETSSKSTKLLHGGVRYLEKAVKKLSWENLKLVIEALQERRNVIETSPYLTRPLQIMLPIYNYFYIPYFYAGLVLYDLIAGTKSLGRSYIMGKDKTLKTFDKLRKDKLKGSVVYYDAQQNDARNNLMLCLTAAYYGSDILNYAEVVDFVKDSNYITGVRVKDRVTGKEFIVKCRGVINTTGPFTDNLRIKGGCEQKIMTHSSGTHIVLPGEYSPKDMGIVDPNTSDGRVMFVIPWRGKTIVGTTDEKCELEWGNKATKKEINFLVENLKDYIQENDLISKIKSAWKGIRPLVKDIKSKNTESISRNHVIKDEGNGLISLTGGKWTTYRQMAEDAVDKAVEVFKLNPKRECVSRYVKVIGSIGYTKNLFKTIMKDLNVPESTALHLADTYGMRYQKIKEYSNGNYTKLSKNYNFLEEEVEYSIDNEMAVNSTDILTRRMGLAFLDVKEAMKCVNSVAKIMKNKLGWSKKQEKNDKLETIENLKCYGYGIL